jgi:hypothetical protein
LPRWRDNVIFNDEPTGDKTHDPIPDTQPPKQPDGLAEGERLKAEAFGRLEATRESLLIKGRRALLTKALNDGVASADDVRDAVPVPPGVNPKVFGPVPLPLARANIIRSRRPIKTRRAIGHARFITEWELIDPPAAMRWLFENPEPPTADEGVAV